MNLWQRLLLHRWAGPLRDVGARGLSLTSLTAWATLHTGQHLKVDLSSSVGRSIWLRGVYEVEVEDWTRKVLRPGDGFVDVGAHVGYFSITSSRIVGANGEVHCFEPNARLLRLLKASIRRNGLQNVSVHPWAIWSRSEPLELAVQKDSGFSYVRRVAGGPTSSRSRIEKAITVDEYVSSFVQRPVKLVKVDVEGAECHVLLGMRGLLQTQSPCLILESVDWNLSRYGHRLEDMFELLHKCDYTCFLLNGESVRHAEEARQKLQGLWVKNLVFEKAASTQLGGYRGRTRPRGAKVTHTVNEGS